MLTKNKAHITENAARQISTPWDFKAEHFFPPMALGAALRAMPAPVHFATMVEVLMTAIKFGTETAPEICIGRIRSLRRELQLVVTRVNAYLQLHYDLLASFRTEVRNLLVEAINDGMNEGFHALAIRADELQGNCPHGAPAPGTTDSVAAPKFKRLKH
ncbi:unnamed protein product [Pylaiella littoralis]